MANMQFRQLDSTGDWTFGSGIANYASGVQAIQLNIQTSILMWAGDCFFSLSGGNGVPSWVNWKQLLSVGKGSQQKLDASLQLLLAQCYGVIQVVSANVVVNRTTRNFFAQYNVDTVYTQSIVSQIQILSGQAGN